MPTGLKVHTLNINRCYSFCLIDSHSCQISENAKERSLFFVDSTKLINGTYAHVTYLYLFWGSCMQARCVFDQGLRTIFLQQVNTYYTGAILFSSIGVTYFFVEKIFQLLYVNLHTVNCTRI